jgi:hypothetical protein
MAEDPFADTVIEEAVEAAEIDLDPMDEFREKLDAFKVLRSNDQGAADGLFEALGGKGKVEEEMLLQLGAWSPLYKADRFERAHHDAMRAVEVLYRNGHRKAAFGGWGPLKFLSDYAIQIICRLIVRDHVKSVVDNVHNLYMRRWTSAPKDTDDARMLRRAWFQVEKVSPTYRGRSLGLPTFLLGGAFISSVASLLGSAVQASIENKALLAVLGAVVAVVLLGLAWCVLRGAAIARRRIKLALDQPLRVLWDVVGAAGKPPRDNAMQFALYSLIVMALAAIVVPIIIGVAVATG